MRQPQFDIQDFVARSRAAQGLPPTVEEPTALRAIARLVQKPADDGSPSTPTRAIRAAEPSPDAEGGC